MTTALQVVHDGLAHLEAGQSGWKLSKHDVRHCCINEVYSLSLDLIVSMLELAYKLSMPCKLAICQISKNVAAL